MKKIKSSVLAICALGVISTACVNVGDVLAPKSKKKSNRITNTSRDVNAQIGDDNVTLQVISKNMFRQESLTNKMLSPNSTEFVRALRNLPQGHEAAARVSTTSSLMRISEDSLLLGFPIGLVGEQNIFGGVITEVSDLKNESLGMLKLTDLPPLHVKTLLTGLDSSTPAITLIGCAYECDENSQQHALMNLPILGFNQEAQMLVVDLSTLGDELDLMSMLDPKGEYTKLKTVSSTTTAFDYSYSTLVFDVASKMVPVDSKPEDENVAVTEFKVRWYLKLNSGFNPAFTSRNNTEGVGYFTTERSSEPKITRFSTTNDGSSVHYYIKNVPDMWKKAFSDSLDKWNEEFYKTLGRDLLTYEFIDANDPKSNEIITGDIRYNVIEWDLKNKAPYGGLGPSMANQFSGEIFSANVLIQGPTIIDLYTKWFNVSQEVHDLKRNGLAKEANEMIKNFHVEVDSLMAKRKQHHFTLKLGKSLEMNINAQRVELEDPMVKGHFDLVPEDVDYKEYMGRYFKEMLKHELGHNLGLRHNFKGNLGDNQSRTYGSVSRSVMEYLSRNYLYLNTIGVYDAMAIAYGYAGKAPKHLDWYCTDEDQADFSVSGDDLDTMLANVASKSPECSSSDNTSDPYSYFEGRIKRAIDLIVEKGSASAPVWKTKEVRPQVDSALKGLAVYAMSAEKTGDTWTNFFGKANRPDDKKDVKQYVLATLKNQLCDPTLQDIIAAKESVEAQETASQNLDDLRKAIAANTAKLKLYKVEDFNCN